MISLSIYAGDDLVAYRLEDDEQAACDAVARLPRKYFENGWRVIASRV